MEQEGHQTQKKFSIRQQWHRTKPNTKIYKLRISLSYIMIKAQQKLRGKFEVAQNNGSNSAQNNQKNVKNQAHQDQFHNVMSLQEPSNPNNPASQPNPSIQKYGYSQKPIRIYQDFSNRGKYETLKYYYSRQKQRLTLLIQQNYFINQLKCKQFDLLLIYQYFTKTWTEEYVTIIQAFMKYSKQFKTNDIVKFEFIAIDIIGVTFDIVYFNKSDKQQLKRFRFRYSIFEFRQHLFFLSLQERNTQQTMSFIQVTSNNIYSMTHEDFYTSPRLGFLDDINNNNNNQIWKRVIHRFWVFYQLHCLFRGVGDFQEFNKKALGRVHFHSVRMKKFTLIFPFPLLHKSVIEDKKQGTLYFTFYLDDKDINITQNSLQFKMMANLVQHHSIITHEQKQQLFHRLKKEEIFNLIEMPIPPKHNQLFQFAMVVKFDDKISRAFAKFSTVVSFFLDKIAFNQIRGGMNNNQRQLASDQAQNQRIIQIYSKKTVFKQQQYKHTHQLIIELKHKYLVPVYIQHNNKLIDQIQFVKLSKKKWKQNIKQKVQVGGPQKNQIFINEELKKYIKHVLKSKPLRQCYNQIMSYLQKVLKVIYCPFQANNALTRLQNRQMGLSLIISNIMRFLDLQNHTGRKSQITIITEDHHLFMRDQKQHDLIAQVTFNIKDLKICWIKRLPQGYIILRMFQNKIQILKDLTTKITMKINYASIQKNKELDNKNVGEKSPLTGLQKINNDLMMQLKNILLKQFTTLQNMMV